MSQWIKLLGMNFFNEVKSLVSGSYSVLILVFSLKCLWRNCEVWHHVFQFSNFVQNNWAKLNCLMWSSLIVIKLLSDYLNKKCKNLDKSWKNWFFFLTFLFEKKVVEIKFKNRFLVNLTSKSSVVVYLLIVKMLELFLTIIGSKPVQQR